MFLPPNFETPIDFVELWANEYLILDTVEQKEHLYVENINSVLDDRTSFGKLYAWKNETGEAIARNKQTPIETYWADRETLLELRNMAIDDNFWSLHKRVFKPHKTAAIWKIFLLHLAKPQEIPIWDKHVHRAFQYIKNGFASDLPDVQTEKYRIYTEQYVPWFNEFRASLGVTTKFLDQALFAFGKYLSTHVPTPIEYLEWEYSIKPEANLKSWFYRKSSDGVNSFADYEDFEDWYNQDKKCHYCGLTEEESQEIVHKGILTSNRFPKGGQFKRGVNRGYWLEIDRKKPKENYSRENCVLSCYFCNNDKSDVFDDEQYEEFVKDRGAFLKGLLK